MIAWISEPDRRKAVLIHDRKCGFELFGQEFVIYRNGSRFLLRIPYGFTVIKNPQIEHQTVTVIRDSETKREAYIYWSIYDRGYELFRKAAWKEGQITLGSSISDDIYLQDENIRPNQFVISRKEHRIMDRYGSGIGDLSGKAVTDNCFHDGDRFRVLNIQILLSDMFLAVSSTANTYCTLPEIIMPEAILPQPEPSFIPERTYQEPVEEMHMLYELDPPTPLDNPDRRPLIFMMGPALMMSSASLITGLLSAYNGWLSGRPVNELAPVVILPSVMVLSALLWNPLQRVHERKTEKLRKQKRGEEYETYLGNIKREIAARMKEMREHTETRFNIPNPQKFDLWRGQTYQSDFLTVRIGTGEIRFDVQLNRSFRCTAADPVGKMIQDFEADAGKCRMPVIVPLKKYRKISVAYDDNRIDYLIGLFLQLLFFHGPDSLNIVLLGTADLIEHYPWIMEIPHLKRNDGIRCIAFSAADAAEIAASLKIADEKEILVICLRESLLPALAGCDVGCIIQTVKGTAPQDAELRISLGETGMLCGSGIHLAFEYDPVFALSAEDCISLFSRCGIRENTRKKNRSVTFFDLYGQDLFRNRFTEQYRERSSAVNHLYAYIGIGGEGETIILDLNENGNGPHGLIAGMTGSEKSELIITILLSLCVNYSPREFQFVMVDFKGGGAAALFSSRGKRVKHAAGILSNLDEQDIERALVSFQNECLRREQLFSSLSRSLSRPVMNLTQYKKLWTAESGLPYLASLLIIVDEFAELKKERPEVMRDLISIARVGRSLGIHMILATQKPGGIVDEQIWSNTRFKLCLKVQDKADSMEMIHSPDASFIRNAGEGFMLCDGIRTHFQCGYANAPVGGERRKLQLLDHTGRVLHEEAMDDEYKEVQSEVIISELCRIDAGCEDAHRLWCDPIERLGREDLPAEHKIWIGIIDDYKKRRQIPYSFNTAQMAVFSSNRKEKDCFLRTILAGVLECAEADDEVFIVDDLGVFDNSVTECGTVCARLNSRDDERCRNLIRHMLGRDREVSGICTLIITDTASFYETNEENRILLRSLITTAELRKLRLVLCFSSISSASYRDLSMIHERIALKNDSLQELSAIFEQSVHRRITKEGTAMLLAPDLLDLSFIRTTSEDLEQAAAKCAHRLGTVKKYEIPCMPLRISLASYRGTQYPAGIDLHTYEWVEIPKQWCLIILATYEEELYDYYEVMKNNVEHVSFLPEAALVKTCMEDKKGNWIFLTADLYQMYGLKQSMAPVLYIGSGFNDQYRFTYRAGKDLKENQGILFQRGRNRMLQLIEESGI